jgi:hypothetical protein
MGVMECVSYLVCIWRLAGQRLDERDTTMEGVTIERLLS